MSCDEGFFTVSANVFIFGGVGRVELGRLCGFVLGQCAEEECAHFVLG